MSIAAARNLTGRTSDLSVNEFLLIEDAGFEPLGLVVGRSTYHVGIQVVRWSASQELDILTRAMCHARELAMERMQFDARQAGSQGVLGVRIIEKNHIWGHHAIEFFAIGTAVTRFRDGGPSIRPRMVLTLDD